MRNVPNLLVKVQILCREGLLESFGKPFLKGGVCSLRGDGGGGDD